MSMALRRLVLFVASALACASLPSFAQPSGPSIEVPGAKQVFYGVCLLVVVMMLPDGIWPWLARRLKLERGT